MEINTTSLLPYVLDLLSRQPDLCTSIDALCGQIQDVVMDDVISPFGTLKRAVEFSVELGMNLGLLLLSEKRVRMPFNFRTKSDKKQIRVPKSKEILSPEQNRQVMKRLSKPLKSPQSAGMKQKAKGKPRPKGRPTAGGKYVAVCSNTSKVRRPTGKKRGMSLRQTIRQNPIGAHTTESRSRRY